MKRVPKKAPTKHTVLNSNLVMSILHVKDKSEDRFEVRGAAADEKGTSLSFFCLLEGFKVYFGLVLRPTN